MTHNLVWDRHLKKDIEYRIREVQRRGGKFLEITEETVV